MLVPGEVEGGCVYGVVRLLDASDLRGIGISDALVPRLLTTLANNKPCPEHGNANFGFWMSLPCVHEKVGFKESFLSAAHEAFALEPPLPLE